MNGDLVRNRDEKGFSIIELLVVMLIISTLLGIGFFSFRSMNDRYTIERQMKEMHMDLMNARLRAMQRNRIHFVKFTSSPPSPPQYAIYEDTDPSPDGDAQLDTTKDTLFLTKSLSPNFPVAFPAAWSSNSTALLFTPRGVVDTLATSTGTVRVTVEKNGEYDCIVISEMKNTLGKWDATSSQCIAK